MKTCTDIGTSNMPSNKTPTTAEIFASIHHIQALLRNARKLRYVLHEGATIHPVVSKTKSYEMVILHPAGFGDFLSRLEMREDQLSYSGLTMATPEEWMEWAKEAATLMTEKRSEGQSG